MHGFGHGHFEGEVFSLHDPLAQYKAYLYFCMAIGRYKRDNWCDFDQTLPTLMVSDNVGDWFETDMGPANSYRWYFSNRLSPERNMGRPDAHN